MKPGIVISIAVAAMLGAAWYAIYGVDDQAIAPPEATIEKNVDGLFNKITAQTAGSSAAAGNANAAVARGKMLGFEGERNLFEFYTRNKDASDPTAVYQAYRAISTCQSLQANASNLRNSLNADIQPPLTQERRAATEDILRRCQGFDRFSEREWNDTVNTLREKTQKLGSVEAKLDSGTADMAIDPDTMIALLQANSSTAYERATPIFSSMLKNSLKISPDTSDAQHVDFAVYLASCDLGRDCSEGAWSVIQQCAFDNYCQKPLSSTWQENLQQHDVKHVLELKEKVLQMIKTNQYSGLRS